MKVLNEYKKDVKGLVDIANDGPTNPNQKFQLNLDKLSPRRVRDIENYVNEVLGIAAKKKIN